MKDNSPGPICIGDKCQRYQVIKPWGAGCTMPTKPGDLWQTEWIRLDRMKGCPGVKMVDNNQAGGIN